MRNTLIGRLPGCAIGFFIAALALPMIVVESIPALALAACLLAALYIAARLITRLLTMAFDLILLGLPRLFLEAWVLMLLCRIVPGISIEGYWPSMALLLCGLAGMEAGRWIAQERPPIEARA